jgi:heme/copper-type cytochrome/quinol oxidase subunit 1
MNLFKDFILRLVLCVKDIGTMYIVYGAIAGIVGTMFLIVIKMELAYLSIQFFVNYYQYYKVDIVYGLVFFFWVLIIALFIDFVN